MQLMAGGMADPAKEEAEYQAIMAKVRSGKPRTEEEANRLAQIANMRAHQRALNATQTPRSAPEPKNANPPMPVPTHQQERGSLPRVVTNPYSLIGDAMRQKGKQ